MDQPAQSGPFKGKTLLNLSATHPANVDPNIWLDFYKAVPRNESRGRCRFACGRATT